MKRRFSLLAFLALLASAASAADMGLYGWGLRIGVGDDPDQIVVGLHQDFGEFVENLRFQPSFDLGFGDDQTLVSLAIPVQYRFPGSAATPYIGAGLQLTWVDRDLPPGSRADDSEFDVSPLITGGIEWRATRTDDFLLEVQLAGGAAHDARVVVGWIFRAD